VKPLRIAPSLLACDFTRLADEIRRAEDAGADWLHVDVMDGHFVPNLTIGPGVVEQIRKIARVPLDVHLMIEEPERYAGEFLRAGADSLTAHAEAFAPPQAREWLGRGYAVRFTCRRLVDEDRLGRFTDAVAAAGRRWAIALNPQTGPEVLDDGVAGFSMILAMTVWPGFGGQSFLEDVLAKVRQLRSKHPQVDIEVDGGVDARTARAAVAAGANVLVAGTAVFHAPDARAAVEAIRASAQEAAHGA
jgi:ribulose-phosphate 3-epimerase